MGMSMRPAAALIALSAAVLSPHAASAHQGDDDSRRGSCSNGAEWEIKVKPDDGRIEVEVKVDGRAGGQTWVWVLKHNGSLSARGTARTRGGSGSFDIERTTVDVPGVDVFRFRATRNRAVCVATIQY